jgi:hypothetical protein
MGPSEARPGLWDALPPHEGPRDDGLGRDPRLRIQHLGHGATLPHDLRLRLERGTMRPHRTVAAIGIVVGLAACRASTSAAPDARKDGVASEASTGDGAVEVAPSVCPSSSAPHAAPCPSSCPTSSTACAAEGARCEYGDDPRGPACRVTAVCQNGGWETTPLDVSNCEPLSVATDCPSSAAPAGQACGVEHSWCALPAEGTACLCTTCAWSRGTFFGPCPAGTPQWRCLARPPGIDARCPAWQPTLGTTCTTDLSCLYQCGAGGLRICRNGVWIGSDGGLCPV